ncbi:pilus assembly protein TadG-related protein [Celeribacter persicus]|jgi:Flp pilus assembly protein TadG|uniref:Flp pilus assembly protein TadG n=1 Tax=Celeribacter persicus TaxID=1651082 RepID=A0A2T5HI84_9RHOB|nr:pilus assembly protein TadG-related protein [Celeribacter persicus]PTQ71285.1 Flp pilus assembly protein TadG [Celeribacter persicus]
MLNRITRREAGHFYTGRGHATGRAERQNMRHAPVSEVLRATSHHLRKLDAQSHMRDEEGSLAIFGLFSFVILLLLAGIGIDIVRHETLRTELQNTLDRAVLAATNLENTNDPKDVIIDYFAKAGLSQYLLEDEISVVPLGDGRQVSASIAATIPTYFMKFASVDSLSMASESVAEQGLSGLEISLVLDVSGSMNSYSRLSNLKSAATDFTQTVFENAASDEIAISVIPYATQVNAGRSILDKLDLLNAHHQSHCINFEEDDFSTTAIDYASGGTGRYYDQTMDFDAFSSDWNNLDMALSQETCPPESSREILPFSNDKSTIDTFIQSLTANGNTSIDLGVKWGAALLDESAQTVTAGTTASAHPAANADAQKYMVVMTDGSHTNQYLIPDPYRDDDESTGVYEDTNGRIYVSAERTSCSYYYGYNCTTTMRYTRIDNKNVSTSLPYTLASGNIREMTWAEVWSEMTVYNHAYARYLASGDSDDYYDWRDKTRISYGTSTKNNRLNEICTAAKEAGIIIFAIGFEAPSAGQQVLQSCASSDAHYYDVDGVEISEAFSAIASKITELRLVE